MQGRNVPNFGQFVPREKSRMNRAAYMAETKGMAEALERRLILVRGHTQESARSLIAEQIGCSPGTLVSLSKSRLKGFNGWMKERLRFALIEEFEQEVEAIAHELEKLKQSGSEPDCLEIQEIEACLETARQKLAQALRQTMATRSRR